MCIWLWVHSIHSIVSNANLYCITQTEVDATFVFQLLLVTSVDIRISEDIMISEDIRISENIRISEVSGYQDIGIYQDIRVYHRCRE